MSETIKRSETVTMSADGLYRGVTVHTPFPLEDSDFLRLTKVNSLLPIWAHTFFTGTSVFSITIFSKWFTHKYSDGAEIVTNTEWTTLKLLILCALVFEVLYLALPSEKKKVISKIKKHFEENKPKAAGFKHE